MNIRGSCGEPFVNILAKAKPEDIAFQQESAVEMYLIPGIESLERLNEVLVKFSRPGCFKQFDKSGFIHHFSFQITRNFWPLEALMGHCHNHSEVKFIIPREAKPLVVQGSEKVRLSGDSVGDTIVIVLCSIVPILNEMVFFCNHK
jgi:hypothetical protein